MNELPGRISIRGLRCRGRQGPTPTDQQQLHDYLVDVVVSVDIADLATCVRDEVARRPRVLLERVAADVARAVIERFERVDAVGVKIEKPEPASLDAAAEAVEITISRSSTGERSRGATSR